MEGEDQHLRRPLTSTRKLKRMSVLTHTQTRENFKVLFHYTASLGQSRVHGSPSETTNNTTADGERSQREGQAIGENVPGAGSLTLESTNPLLSWRPSPGVFPFPNAQAQVQCPSPLQPRAGPGSCGCSCLRAPRPYDCFLQCDLLLDWVTCPHFIWLLSGGSPPSLSSQLCGISPMLSPGRKPLAWKCHCFQAWGRQPCLCCHDWLSQILHGSPLPKPPLPLRPVPVE